VERETGGHDDTSQKSRHQWKYERDHGASFDRVAYFTDAVFAIAMTLLIVSVEAPGRGVYRPRAGTARDLGPQLSASSSPVAGRYWMAHTFFAAALIDRRFTPQPHPSGVGVPALPYRARGHEENPSGGLAPTSAISGGVGPVPSRARTDMLARPMTESAYRYGMI
jgi:hypothetical protein